MRKQVKRKSVRKAVRNLECPYCGSQKAVLRGFRKNDSGDKQLFLCKKCGRKFTRDDGYLRMRFSPEDIKEAVSLYGKGFSSAEVRTRLGRRGVRVSRWTVLKWVKRFEK